MERRKSVLGTSTFCRPPLLTPTAAFPQRFIKEFRHSTVYYEQGEAPDQLNIITNTRRRVRLPGTEGMQDSK